MRSGRELGDAMCFMDRFDIGTFGHVMAPRHDGVVFTASLDSDSAHIHLCTEYHPCATQSVGRGRAPSAVLGAE